MDREIDELFDEELQKIFRDRNLKTEALMVMLDNAKKSSVNVETVERKTVLEKIDLKKIGVCISGVVLSALLIVGTGKVVQNVGQFVGNIVSSVSSLGNSDYSMFKLSREIGALVDDKTREDYEGPQSILSQNTVRANDIVYYSHENIARDLLKLDSNLFDYAFCALCVDMGGYINNQVGVGGMSNIDSVIYYLKMFSGNEGYYANQYVSEALADVSSLDDYLVKFGYVDKDGKPSLDAFRKSCDNNAEAIYTILHGQEKTEGAKLS